MNGIQIRTLNPFAHFLVRAFEYNTPQKTERKITVNPIVSEIASWYEKLRNAMDYREDEVILRAAIERIVKRRFMLGGDGSTIAGPLIRELIWARYFPDGSIPETTVEQVAKTINLHVEFRKSILSHHPSLKEKDVNEWIYHLMSSDIAHRLNPNRGKEDINNFMFHIFKEAIVVPDDSEEVKNAQVFIAIRQAYARDDTAFLRYHLFHQFFGELNHKTVSTISSHFVEGYRTIETQLHHPLRHKIYSYIKKHTPPFLILEDILRQRRGHIREFLADEENFGKAVFAACDTRYSTISSKVQRAIIRSVVFILLSKAFFALGVEGTYENMVYGKVLWGGMALNVFIPPLLMVIAGLLIKTPGYHNSVRILDSITTLLFDPHPTLAYPISLRRNPEKSKSFLYTIFTFLWLATFFLSFGLIVFVLSKLHFNLVSQGVFLFFLAIVSFLSYRIYLLAHTYTVEGGQSFATPVVDFFFMPMAQVGRYLTQGIAQLNVLILILDFIIETPFKGFFAFFEQWFFFLHAKRERLE